MNNLDELVLDIIFSYLDNRSKLNLRQVWKIDIKIFYILYIRYSNQFFDTIQLNYFRKKYNLNIKNLKCNSKKDFQYINKNIKNIYINFNDDISCLKHMKYLESIYFYDDFLNYSFFKLLKNLNNVKLRIKQKNRTPILPLTGYMIYHQEMKKILRSPNQNILEYCSMIRDNWRNLPKEIKDQYTNKFLKNRKICKKNQQFNSLSFSNYHNLIIN